MTINPTDPMKYVLSFFDFLNRLIQEDGVYLYMVIVWLSPLLIIWIMRGGVWRKPTPRPARPPIIIVMRAEPPPLPPADLRKERPQANGDIQAFDA
jgi:hypothetical protein